MSAERESSMEGDRIVDTPLSDQARMIHDRLAAAADLAAILCVLGLRRLRRIATKSAPSRSDTSPSLGADTTRRLSPAGAQPDSHLRGFATVFQE